ncbi:MAG: NAD(P)H-hydrate dehydratase [Coriobacteriia bacterium]|nr:NAD(P)H-hydrate dehydratase [Coriobacteriia bacterium]
MRFAITADRMRAAENEAVSSGATTIPGLMERAGGVLAAEVTRRWPDGRVVVVCGPGNNGGDGWVAARLLAAQGRHVAVLALREPGELAAEARQAAEAAAAAGVRWAPVGGHDDQILRGLPGAAAIIDAIFGFGFAGPPLEPYAEVMEAINRARCPVISADVPSGVDSDTGVVRGCAVRADVTVAFSALKPGLLIYPGAAHAGEVVVAGIGVPPSVLGGPGDLEVLDIADLHRLMPRVRPEDHKSSRGRVAVVAGSLAYAGAAVLTATGALRMGAGYVYVVVPETIGDVVRIALPNVIVRTVPASADGSIASADAVLGAVADADAIVAGPGLTTGAGSVAAVRALVSEARQPLVLDADGLNVYAGNPRPLVERRAPLLITPHPGEAARLLSESVVAIQDDRVGSAGALTGATTVCLLKGPHTIVAGQGRPGIVLAGSGALARAGSGDVLAGMAGTLMAQGLPAYEAGMLAAHLHGRAGEIGAAALTETCFTSADIATFLPEAVRELIGG